MAYRDYSTAIGKIVDPNNKGDYTTISAALADAVSGDIIFLRPGTYTEDITAVAGVSLVTFDTGIRNPQVNIVGKISFSSAGTFEISGIRLTTNADYFLEISGTSDSIVNIDDCVLDCADHTGISYTTTSASANLTIIRCLQEITDTFALFEKSSPGGMTMNYTYGLTASQTTTPNTVTAGDFTCNYCTFGSPFAISGTTFSFFMMGMTVDSVAITTSGTVTGQLLFCNIDSGSNAGISIGTGTIMRIDPLCRINNSAANAIIGAGTLIYSALSFVTTSSFNPTTIISEQMAIGRISSSSGVDAIVTATNGEVTFPNTSAFLANHSVAQTAVTGDGTLVTINFTNVIYDLNSDYDGTNTFTAQVTGRYRFSGSLYVDGISAANTSGFMQLVTSNRIYQTNVYSYAAIRNSGNLVILPFSFVADMDALDTAFFQCQIDAGPGKNISFPATATQSFFGGELIC